jgi:hypothetical protein
MINDDQLLALFNSPARMLKAEQILRKSALSCRLVPAPREVAEGCALALRFAMSDKNLILSELARQELPPQSIYRREKGLFQKVFPLQET